MGREAQLGQMEWVAKPGRLNEKLIFWDINVRKKNSNKLQLAYL